MVKNDIQSIYEIDFKNITKNELNDIDYFSPVGKFDSIIIIPLDKIHDSGYKCMKFVLCKSNKIVGCVGGNSDIIHFNGIGGYGLNHDIINRKGYDYRIDCLPCGFLRLFCADYFLVLDCSYIFPSD